VTREPRRGGDPDDHREDQRVDAALEKGTEEGPPDSPEAPGVPDRQVPPHELKKQVETSAHVIRPRQSSLRWVTTGSGPGASRLGFPLT